MRSLRTIWAIVNNRFIKGPSTVDIGDPPVV